MTKERPEVHRLFSVSLTPRTVSKLGRLKRVSRAGASGIAKGMTTYVRDVMAKEPKTAAPDMAAADAAGLMASHDIGVVPIVQNDGALVGLVTDRDLVVRVLAERRDPLSVPLADIATRRSLRTISADATVAEARDAMATHRVKRLVVTEGDAFVSVVSLGDVAQAEGSMREVGETVREITASPATTEGTEPTPPLRRPREGDLA